MALNLDTSEVILMVWGGGSVAWFGCNISMGEEGKVSALNKSVLELIVQALSLDARECFLVLM